MSFVTDITKENKHILLEKYNLDRINLWTGRRYSINKSIGRNWMTYYCLKGIVKNTGPLDCIMYLINEFLNWIPAGCWKNAKIFTYSCLVCNCGTWGRNFINESVSFCSYECQEKNGRQTIINEQDDINHLFNLINYYPQEVNQVLELILDEFNEYLYYDCLQWDTANRIKKNILHILYD